MSSRESSLDPGQHANWPRQPLAVVIERSEVPLTDDVGLWELIYASSKKLSFDAYDEHMRLACEGKIPGLRLAGAMPFWRAEPYRLLKAATDLFLQTQCGSLNDFDWHALARSASAELGRHVSEDFLQQTWSSYVNVRVTSADGHSSSQKTLPYLAELRKKFPEWTLADGEDSQLCQHILTSKLTRPCLIELIWSYWHEEAMLVQVMNAVSLRFQNRRAPGDRGVLTQLELDPLRPLSNLLWGYVQDEQHRLSIQRRAYEYDHEYGLQLVGKAVRVLRSADSRSNFLEGFHRLLNLAARFYQQDDVTTVRADAFPLLNALKEVNIALGEGGGNQYGDLPWVARGEMLMQQWLLARPEMGSFLAGRPSAIYPAPWMDRLETAKSLLGLSGPSVLHMTNLAEMGERLLLSIRFQNWTRINDVARAANWARRFRSDVQGYIHAYHAATGVDLSASSVTDRIDTRLPSQLMQERLEAFARR